MGSGVLADALILLCYFLLIKEKKVRKERNALKTNGDIINLIRRTFPVGIV
jgi:hypothetical protein